MLLKVAYTSTLLIYLLTGDSDEEEGEFDAEIEAFKMKLEMSQPQPERPKPVRLFCLSFFYFYFSIFPSLPPFPPATPAAGLSRSLTSWHSCRFLVLSLSLTHALCRSLAISRSLARFSLAPLSRLHAPRALSLLREPTSRSLRMCKMSGKYDIARPQSF